MKQSLNNSNSTAKILSSSLIDLVKALDSKQDNAASDFASASVSVVRFLRLLVRELTHEGDQSAFPEAEMVYLALELREPEIAKEWLALDLGSAEEIYEPHLELVRSMYTETRNKWVNLGEDFLK